MNSRIPLILVATIAVAIIGSGLVDGGKGEGSKKAGAKSAAENKPKSIEDLRKELKTICMGLSSSVNWDDLDRICEMGVTLRKIIFFENTVGVDMDMEETIEVTAFRMNQLYDKNKLDNVTDISRLQTVYNKYNDIEKINPTNSSRGKKSSGEASKGGNKSGEKSAKGTQALSIEELQNRMLKALSTLENRVNWSAIDRAHTMALLMIKQGIIEQYEPTIFELKDDLVTAINDFQNAIEDETDISKVKKAYSAWKKLEEENWSGDKVLK